MPKSPMVDKFADRAPKSFGDEGEPDQGESPRGSAAGPDDSPGGGPPSVPDVPGMPKMPGMDDEAQAVDDMGDILGIGPNDRKDFGNALSAYVNSCIQKAIGGGAPAGPPGMPPGPPGPPGAMPEEPDEDDGEPA